MPYDISNPPAKLKSLSDKDKRQFIHVFNSCWKEHHNDAKCHKMAWGAVKKASSQVETFEQIRQREDPDGKQHDLRLTCVQCGTQETCRCTKPKRPFSGLCRQCADPEGWAREEAESLARMAEFIRTGDPSAFSKAAREKTSIKSRIARIAGRLLNA